METSAISGEEVDSRQKNNDINTDFYMFTFRKMTTAEESPILIPSEDEEDDDIVVVKEEKVSITIDEGEDQDGEVIFIAQTKAPVPQATIWKHSGMDTSSLSLCIEGETAANGGPSTKCSSGIAGVSSDDDLAHRRESKCMMRRNLSLASAVQISLSLTDADQTPLDLSKTANTNGGNAGVNMAILSSDSDDPISHSEHFVSDLDNNSFDDSSNGSITFRGVDPAASNPVLMSNHAQTTLTPALSPVTVIPQPFPITLSSQSVNCPSLNTIHDTAITSTVFVSQDLKALNTDSSANVYNDMATTSPSQRLSCKKISLGSCTGQTGPIKLSSSSSTDTQLLVDFLMDDDISAVFMPGNSDGNSIGAVSSSACTPSSSMQVGSIGTHETFIGQTPTSVTSVVIQTKTVCPDSIKTDIFSAASDNNNAPSLCDSDVVGLTAQASSQQLQQQCSSSSKSLATPICDFSVLASQSVTQASTSNACTSGVDNYSSEVARIIAQVLDHQNAATTGIHVPVSSSLTSSLSALSPNPPASLLPFAPTSVSTQSRDFQYHQCQTQIPPVVSVATTATFSVSTSTCKTMPSVCPMKRLNPSTVSMLDNSSLPPRKRVRPAVQGDTFSNDSSSLSTISSGTSGKSLSVVCANSVGGVGIGEREGGLCERCQNSIVGTQLSRCTQGHRACGQCLEEQVKLVLTGRQKGSLKCIARNCNSFYPMSELKHSLPNMVVEILEDKLDRDYVEYISDMMLLNATPNSSTSDNTSVTSTDAPSTPTITSVSKTNTQVQTSDTSDNDIDDESDDIDDENGGDNGDSDDNDNSDFQNSDDASLDSPVSINICTNRTSSSKSSIANLKEVTKTSSRSVSLADSFKPSTSTKDDNNDDDEMSEFEWMDEDETGDLTLTSRQDSDGCDKQNGKSNSSDQEHEKQKDYPENWAKMDNNTTLLAVPLLPDSEEYIEMAIRFHDTMSFPQADITKILRIQNPILWKYFSLKRLEMVQENDGLSVEEKMLFHGTKCSVIDAICRKGFDWRVCGKHGVAYGHGCYFARDSIYSHNYTDRTSDGAQSSVVLRSVSAARGDLSGNNRNFSSSHLAPASVTLASLNPSPNHSLMPRGLLGGSSGLVHKLQGPGNVGLNGGDDNTMQATRGHHRLNTSSHCQLLRKIMTKLVVARGCRHMVLTSQPSHTHPLGSVHTTSNILNSPGILGMPVPISSTTNMGNGLPNRIHGSAQQSLHRINPQAQPAPQSQQSLHGITPQAQPAPQSQQTAFQSQHASSTQRSMLLNSQSAAASQGASQPSPMVQMLGISSITTLPTSSSSASQLPGSGSLKPQLASAMMGSYISSNGLSQQPPPPPPPPQQQQQSANIRPCSCTGFLVARPPSGILSGPNSTSVLPCPHSKNFLLMSRQPPTSTSLTIAPQPSHLPHPHPLSPLQTQGQQSAAHSTHVHLLPPPWVRPPSSNMPFLAHANPESAKYSSGSRYMFLSKVLVGRSTGGSVGLRRPPPLDQNEPFGKCYDSCVDNIFDPKIFVIFDSNQAYPEYIIEYKFVE